MPHHNEFRPSADAPSPWSPVAGRVPIDLFSPRARRNLPGPRYALKGPDPAEAATEEPWERRAYQRAALAAALGERSPACPDGVRPPALRCFFLLWRRQAGKSTTLAEAAVCQMIRHPGRLVTYASASLLMGREILYKEAAVLRRAIARCRPIQGSGTVEVGPAGSGCALPAPWPNDDFADLFEQQRLELRLHLGGGAISRTLVIAPNPATARGWTGTVLLDEFGFIRDLAELWEAVEPIVSVQPGFRLIGATTPPSDDAHFSYRLTEPPPARIFTPNPDGSWYRSAGGHWVHRVDVHDAAAAGLGLFDLESGRPMTPAEHLAAAPDREAWLRNYGVQHVRGGTAAVSWDALEAAQAAGERTGRFFFLDRGDETALADALAWLPAALGDGPVGVGWDVASTEGGSSNPTALAVVEQVGGRHVVRALLLWKSCRPDLSIARGRALAQAVAERRCGGPLRRVCIDATNERAFAAMAAAELGVPVQEFIAGARCDMPGEREPVSGKLMLGCRLVHELELRRVALPPGAYVRDDFRRIRRKGGAFHCSPGPNGEHGDTFDAVKLALHALAPPPGAVESLDGFRWSRGASGWPAPPKL